MQIMLWKELGKDIEKGVSQEAQTARNSLFEKVFQAGLYPVALLPAPIFKTLCEKFSLYRFEHINQQGRVSHNISWLLWVSASMVALIPAGIIAGILTILETPPNLPMAMILYGLSVVATVLVSITRPTPRAVVSAHQKAIQLLPHAIQLRMLWPKKIDTTEWHSMTIPLFLKGMPKRFQENMEKCRIKNLQPMIAADARAIIHTKAITEQAMENAIECPMLYTQQNGWIAILDHYGNLPNEKEVIAEIRKGIPLSP